MALLATLTSCGPSHVKPSDQPLQYLADWQYRWTDRDALPLDDAWDAPDWHAATLPWLPRPQRNILWLRTRLPPTQWADPVLRTWVQASFEVYVDGQRVYTWPTTGLDGPGFHNYATHLVSLPLNSGGQVLSLRVSTWAWTMGVRGVPAVGERTDHLLWMMEADGARWPVGWMMVIMAAFTVVALVRRDAWRMPLGFAMVCIGLGAAVLCRTFTKTLVAPSPLWLLTWASCGPTLTTGLLLFLNQLLGSGRRRIFHRLLQLNLGVMALLPVVAVFIWKLQTSASFEDQRMIAWFAPLAGTTIRLALVVSVPLIVARVTYRAARGNPDARILTAGIAVLCITVVDTLYSGAGLGHGPWHPRLHLGALALAMALALMLKRHYAGLSRQMAQQAADLALKGQEKERMLRDLHDGVGGLASNIRMLAQLGQHNEARTRSALHSIFDLSGRALTEIRSFVQSLDQDSLTWPGLISEMRSMAGPLLEAQQRGLQMKETVDPDAPPPQSMLCLNMLKIFREAVSNACKHGDGPLNVQVTVSRKALQLLMENRNGNGTAPSVSSGKGLGNIRARAQELGGQADVYQGDTVRLSVNVPLRQAALV